MYITIDNLFIWYFYLIFTYILLNVLIMLICMFNTFFINSLVLMYNFNKQMYIIILNVFSFYKEMLEVEIENNKLEFNLISNLKYPRIV